eukprot:CAMPEP_0194490478 /NCGR_PEP_ID=MMETSP0253-20130528/9681_1 /TAXON_ID=2966 /ORGANISM="Noctiluca scintillans" /LENGTH=638 /DNA_ID=CAMNT_0039331111 /DNA_START=48 /DNA_END=1964 /DNA_ORIENTATION=+
MPFLVRRHASPLRISGTVPCKVSGVLVAQGPCPIGSRISWGAPAVPGVLRARNPLEKWPCKFPASDRKSAGILEIGDAHDVRNQRCRPLPPARVRNARVSEAARTAEIPEVSCADASVTVPTAEIPDVNYKGAVVKPRVTVSTTDQTSEPVWTPPGTPSPDQHGGWLQVNVPVGATAGGQVLLPGPSNSMLRAIVPLGLNVGDSFKVQILNGCVFQPQNVPVPEHAKPGDILHVRGCDGLLRETAVPEDATPGGRFVCMVPVAQGLRGVPIGQVLSDASLEPWLEAARGFNMSADFVVQDAEVADSRDFTGLMHAMKASSADKVTIQCLGDKLLLSQLMDTLQIPQMPTLFAVREPSHVSERVREFVDGHLSEGAQPVILKPTHLSNGEGVKGFSPCSFQDRDSTVRSVESHILEFLSKSANQLESQALQSLAPGFVAQPMYQSDLLGPGSPLELRVTSLWGRARTAVWWWGDATPERNVWIVRDEEDLNKWEACHANESGDASFHDAVGTFLSHMPEMSAWTERIAASVGAPFLRADFFVGSADFGVRLNEVAYGSGVAYRRRQMDTEDLVDDAPVMAQILQEGYRVCEKMQGSDTFLTPLGVHGDTYDVIVDDVRTSVYGEHDEAASCTILDAGSK